MEEKAEKAEKEEKEKLPTSQEELDKLITDSLQPTVTPNPDMVVYVSKPLEKLRIIDEPNVIYTEKIIKETLDDLLTWVLKDEKNIMLTRYYSDPTTNPQVPYGSMKKCWYRYPYLKEYYDNIQCFIAEKIATMGLFGTSSGKNVQWGFAKYLLAARHGSEWREVTQSKVEVTQKEVKFKFGNSELEDPIQDAEIVNDNE